VILTIFRAAHRVVIAISSGIRNLEILKTTQSGFEGFHRDAYTSLPETNDRLLGTSASVEWLFSADAINKGGIDFNEVFVFVFL